MSEEKHEWQLKNNPKLDRYFSTAIDKGSHTQDSEPGPQQPQASNSSTGTVYTDMNQNVTSTPENVPEPEIPAERSRYTKSTDFSLWDVLTEDGISLWIQKYSYEYQHWNSSARNQTVVQKPNFSQKRVRVKNTIGSG
jgi:hypothetical protein